MRYYELMMVVPQMDDEGLSATLDRVNNDIGERGGTVVRQQRWGGLRRLAYPINDHNEGNYVLTYLELEPERAGELEANLRVSENVLRHLLLRIDSIPEVKETPPQPAPAAAEATDTAATETPPPADEAADAAAAAEAPTTTDEAPAEEATEAAAPAEEPVAEAEEETVAEAEQEAVAEAEQESAPTAEEESPAADEAPAAQAEDESKEQEN